MKLENCRLLEEPAFEPLSSVWIIQTGGILACTVVQSLVFEMICEPDRSGQHLALRLVGYRLPVPHPSAKDGLFPPNEVYAAREAAELEAEWHPVPRLAAPDWQSMLDDEVPFSMDGALLALRGLLESAHQHGGLVKRDVKRLGTLIADRGFDSARQPIFAFIVSQLGLRLG